MLDFRECAAYVLAHEADRCKLHAQLAQLARDGGKATKEQFHLHHAEQHSIAAFKIAREWWDDGVKRGVL